MKNKTIVENFVSSDEESRTTNLFIEKSYGNFVLYSYGHHFPLCIKLQNGFIVNQDSYSKTTAQHKGLLIRELTYCINNFNNFLKEYENGKYTDIILLTTEQMRSLINENSDLKNITIEELKNKLLLNEIKPQ